MLNVDEDITRPKYFVIKEIIPQMTRFVMQLDIF